MSHLNSKEEPRTQNQQEGLELSDEQLKEASGGVDATPDVPDGIGLSDGEDDSQGVRVTWNAVSGATYKVFRNSTNS